MKCPNCIDTDLVNRHREWLTVDLCPTCQGTWLPRTEFDRLMMSAQRAEAMVDADWYRERQRRVVHPRSSYAYDDDDHEEYRYRHRDGYRRKTWFQQFRDLID